MPGMIALFVIGLLFLIIYIKLEKCDFVYKIFLYLMVIGFTVYSGVGILFQYDSIENNAFLYLIQFFLFCILFFIASYIVRKYRIHYYMPNLDDIAGTKIILVLGITYILCYVYACIFSGVDFSNFLNIKQLFVDYSATTFAVRVARRSSTVYTIVTNQIANITMPFFYIMLYNFRKKPKLFITLYLLPIVLALVADGYISRNKIAVYIAFIFIYLVMEGIIKKRVAAIIVACAVPLLLFAFAMLESIRSGNVSNGVSFWVAIKELIISETEYPKFFDYCADKSKDISLLNYIIYIFVVCIPSQVYSIFGYTTPNLAYSFTEAVIGLSYAETNNYYILLPSVLGEAIMLFGKYFAFLYGFVYGIIATWFLKILKEHSCLKYLLVYYMLDFFRQFRGGSQYVISGWETQLIPLIIIVALISTITIRRN